MDLTTTTTTTKTPDTENETPPHTHPTKPTPYTPNGVLKKHHHHNHHFHHRHPPAAVVTYKECLKNHAANLGGNALDGCGEFMPSSITTTASTDLMSLKCAACGCHRNFHRRDPDEHITTTTRFLDFLHHVPPPHPTSMTSPSSSPPPPPQLTNYYSAPQMLLALSNGTSEDQQHTMNHHHHHNHQVAVAILRTPTAMKSENPSGRKRFRTKFTQDQKKKMYAFSEKLGWKLHNCEESVVDEFCNEVGVGKGVLKVWMHNNKNNLGKRENINTTINMNSGGVRFDYNGNNTHHDDQNESSGAHLHISNHGSSSSS